MEAGTKNCLQRRCVHYIYIFSFLLNCFMVTGGLHYGTYERINMHSVLKVYCVHYSYWP